MAALELRDWIAEAEERGLIATIDEIANIQLGHTVSLVPLEYTKFLLLQYPQRFAANLSDGTVHNPHNFFHQVYDLFIRTGPLSTLTVHGRPNVPSVAGSYYDHNGHDNFHQPRHLIACDDVTRYAESGGSGDGFTRYMFLGSIPAGMPQVFNDPGH